jgi:GMP synthase (glutamine-hydrolysing)
VNALVLEHADHEDSGLVGDVLKARGFALDRRHLHRGQPVPAALDGYDLVLAMGGPQDAWDDDGHPYLAGEAQLLAHSAQSGRLTVAICLGAQLLARGLGARVYRGPRKELGVAPIELTDEGRRDALLAPLEGRSVLHWHSDTFDLPAGAVRLAETAAYANQAFRLGERAWGVQFHIECGTAMRRAWADHGADELRGEGVDPASLWSPDTEELDARGLAFTERLLAFAR